MAMIDGNDDREVFRKLGFDSPLSSRLSVFRDIWLRIRLSWILFRDPRVPAWSKLIPLGVVAYILSPADLLPAFLTGFLGLVDDIVVLTLGLDLFIRSAPPAVVAEHARALGYFSGPELPE
jgi:uncharacterized membrane protein YkvA (DUF1232 family)